MTYTRKTENGYIISLSTDNAPSGGNITQDEYNGLMELYRSKPKAPAGYDYRLKETLEWELYKLPQPETTEGGYTEEQLRAMSSAELEGILSSLGIKASMNKDNMVRLILAAQKGGTE